jgi:hypothetical protein
MYKYVMCWDNRGSVSCCYGSSRAVLWSLFGSVMLKKKSDRIG